MVFDSSFNTKLLWPDATSPILEKIWFTNHWCGAEDPQWVNLATSNKATLDLGVDDDTKFQPNLLLAALQDSNADGQLNSDDSQSLIYVKQDGIAAISAGDYLEQWYHDGLKPVIPAQNDNSNNALAAADLDGDLFREILVLGEDRYLTALTYDGQLLWKSVDQIAVNTFRTSVIIDDLDADGQPEIMVANMVFNADGTTRFSMPSPLNETSREIFEISVLDINADGQLEVIYNDTVYDNTGQILINGLGKGHFNVPVNIDADASSEWIQVYDNPFSTVGRVRLFDHDGSVLWSTPVINVSRPSVADLDHDGLLEIVFPGTLMNQNGEIIYNVASSQVRKIM
ncbi:MAG: hypothetical protein L3J52_10660, partial [Proteobacteria bacterium]|nr:hypothetical protein [Pseudomonadota bacterium]